VLKCATVDLFLAKTEGFQNVTEKYGSFCVGQVVGTAQELVFIQDVDHLILLQAGRQAWLQMILLHPVLNSAIRA
jgi:hypothetical protein